MDLIDTHQHLIYRQSLGYGWTAGIPALSRGDFTLQDYQGLTAGHFYWIRHVNRSCLRRRSWDRG